MKEVADVFRRYGVSYLQLFKDRMLPGHLKALFDILKCRTEEMGGHVLQCDSCGHEIFAYHSCKNRSCPKCSQSERESWILKRHAELLPVSYFHLTFTLPAVLRTIARKNQKVIYSILMKAAATAIITLAKDPRYSGGLTGVMAVLHTWGRTLVHHPHVHCLVPSGGLSEDQKSWCESNPKYLVPVQALSKMFRGKFMEMAKKALPDVKFPESAWNTGWVVNCKSVGSNPEKVIAYLGRYVHRVAISNSRILSIDDGHVVFKYKDTRDSKIKTMRLTAHEFIRRFLQHVLPSGFHKVRYYGLWSPSYRKALRKIQITLPACSSFKGGIAIDRMENRKGFIARLTEEACPKCKKGTIAVCRLYPRKRAPPLGFT